MYLGIYSLLVSCVLVANSFAIINERFLRRFGWDKPARMYSTAALMRTDVIYVIHSSIVMRHAS